MKQVLVITVIIGLIWLAGKIKTEKKELTFLDKTHTDFLRGVAILLVLWGHIGQYSGVNGVEFPAAVGVSIFLVLSGYGLTLSNKSGGDGTFGKNVFSEYGYLIG